MANAIEVEAKEQNIELEGFTYKIRFNMFYNFWYYDVYQGDTLLLAGQKLVINSYPMALRTLPYPQLFLVDTKPESTEKIDPLTDLGNRLELVETDYNAGQ